MELISKILVINWHKLQNICYYWHRFVGHSKQQILHDYTAVLSP